MQTYIRIPHTIGLTILVATGYAGALDANSQLFQAAYDGNTHQAQYVIKNGADVNTQGQYGVTPLHIAARKGRADMAQLLLNNSANVNTQNKNGLTPLHIATWEGHANMARLLINNNANVNTQDDIGYTPLHYANWEGRADMAQLLLNNNTNVNTQDQYGDTPLHISARKGHADIAQLLIKNGANVNANNTNGITPADTAQFSGNTNITTTCSNIINLQQGNIDQVITQDTSLEYKQLYAEAMIAYGYPDIAQQIINHIGSISDDAYANITLHAVQHRNAFDQDTFAAFISHMRNTYENDDNTQAIVNTAWNNAHKRYVSTEVVTWVLNNYEDQCRQFCDNNGNTILHIAAANKQYNALLPRIATLVMQNKNHNPRNKDNKTPVIIARENGNHEGAAIIKNAAWLQSELSLDNYKSYIDFPSEISEHIISYIRGNELPQYTTTQQ